MPDEREGPGWPPRFAPTRRPAGPPQENPTMSLLAHLTSFDLPSLLAAFVVGAVSGLAIARSIAARH